jgi:protein-L-isoaspartate(D-aspartate) O-methyltransferase
VNNVETPETVKLRAEMMTALTAAGALRSPAWQAAFGAVPRHAFLSEFTYRRSGADTDREQITPAHPDYLSLVYSDNAFVTHHHDTGAAASSSTQPSVMALMLEALNVHSGCRVLEVGTGTGYNAALLCHGLGEDNVTTIEVDPAVADLARQSLANIGLHPVVISGDGLAGYPAGAPYDRIIGTCSTARVPASWIAQTRPGGVIVANVGYGVAPLTKHEDGSASGQFLADVAAFIEARPAGGPEPISIDDAIDRVYGFPERTGTFDPVPGIENEEFWFTARIALPEFTYFELHDDDGQGRSACLVDPASGSWARALTTREGHQRILTEAGPRRLWADLQSVYAAWISAGRPAHDRLGLTITPGGAHTIRVANPDGMPGTTLIEQLTQRPAT